jgi:hypothetical protein
VNTTALRQAAYPTARALAWTPLLAAGAGLLVVAAALRLLDSRPGPVLVLGAATMAAALVFSLRDPAAALLAAVPVPLLQRRALRLGLTAAVTLPVWLLVAATVPGEGFALAPLLALAAAGVAVATWLPVDRDVSVAAGVPLAWASLAQLLGDRAGLLGDAAAWWRTDPWWVVVAAALLIGLGRHR